MSGRKVDIKTGPHGKDTTIAIDGVELIGARSFVLAADALGATSLTVTFPAVDATVDGLVETTHFHSESRAYRLPPKVTVQGQPELDDADDVSYAAELVERDGSKIPPIIHIGPCVMPPESEFRMNDAPVVHVSAE